MKYEKPKLIDLSQETFTLGADCKFGNTANLCNYGTSAGNPGQGNKNCQPGGNATILCNLGNGYTSNCAGGTNPN